MDGRRRPTAPEILSVSRLIAEHVAGVSATTLPDRVARATARSVLDAVGVSVGASGIGDGCGPFLRLAATRDRSGSCHVLGTGLRVDVSLAALVNGALAHALDFEDAHDGAMVHPHAAPVAAGLALAEQLASSGRPVGGRRFLAAIAVGADLVCRLGSSLPPWRTAEAGTRRRSSGRSGPQPPLPTFLISSPGVSWTPCRW